jgi:hypothetical protein
MPLFRIVCALGLLFAVAPDKTTDVLQGLMGWSQSVKADVGANIPFAVDQGLAACRQNPEICMEVTKEATRSAAKAR